MQQQCLKKMRPKLEKLKGKIFEGNLKTQVCKVNSFSGHGHSVSVIHNMYLKLGN